MRVSFSRPYRDHSRTFLRVTVASSEPDSRVQLSCSAKEGTPVPCRSYLCGGEEAEDVYFAVLPTLSTPVTLTLSEQDVTGQSIGSPVSAVIEPQNAKRISHFSSKAARAQLAQMRDLDEHRRHDHGVFDFIQVILWGDVFKVRAQLIVPCEADANVKIGCFTRSLVPVGENLVISHDEVRSYRGQTGHSMRVIDFAIDLPARREDYLFTVMVEGRSALDGFAVLGRKQALAFAARWLYTHTDAYADERYPSWFAQKRAGQADLAVQSRLAADHDVSFSILAPLQGVSPASFDRSVLSVVEQSYGAWELLLVGAEPTDAELQDRIEQAVSADERIRFVAADDGGAAAVIAGMEAARGDLIAFLESGDVLEPDALFEYCLVIDGGAGADLVYCDEDHLLDGKHAHPIFKPDFSIDLLRSNDFIRNFFCVRRSVLDKVCAMGALCDGALGYDIALKAFEAGAKTHHIQRVLYHRGAIEDEAASGPSAAGASAAQLEALKAHLERMGIAADANQHEALPFVHDVKYRPPQPAPLVSVIIPTKDLAGVLARCVESIEELTDYPNYEIVLVENNSTEDETFRTYEDLAQRFDNVRTVRWTGEFNYSRIVNFGVGQARGDYLLLLNNDTQVITSDWMTRMVGICSRAEVGGVGARLWYPDNTLQHGGVVIIGEGPQHLAFGLPRGDVGYLSSAEKAKGLCAVTAACMMVRRDAFERVGGFDERLAVAYNDIDFCLRLREAGLSIVYDPAIQLYHWESFSRGYEDTDPKRERFIREISAFRERWARYFVEGDPYYNENYLQTDPFYRLGVDMRSVSGMLGLIPLGSSIVRRTLKQSRRANRKDR